MKIFHDWRGIKGQFKDVVVGLGNFDGVHLGHQRLITSLIQQGNHIGGTPIIFTFYPHPLKILAGKAPLMLTSHQVKKEILNEMGVEVLLLVSFTKEFAMLAPEEFIRQVLVEGLGARSVFVGYNYTFGKGGIGTAKDIKEGGKRYGYDVHVIPPVTVDGIPVSSTLIRKLLGEGKVNRVSKLLGQHYFVDGTVTEGEKRGRTIGFPTANITFQGGLMIPAHGVYAAKVSIGRDIYNGAANIGVKPTFCKFDCQPALEIHLFDFNGNLYGEDIRVYLIERIREEKKFDSAEQLVQEIKMDVKKAKKILGENKTFK